MTRWQIESGAHCGAVRDLAVDPRGELLATCGDDRTLRLWRLDTGALQTTIRAPWLGAEVRAPLRSLAFSPDGEWIAVAGNEVHLVDRRGAVVDRWVAEGWFQPSALTFSVDGRILGCGPMGTVVTFGRPPTLQTPPSELDPRRVQCFGIDSSGRLLLLVRRPSLEYRLEWLARLLTANELDLYLALRVPEIAHGSQTPTSARPQAVSDFPLVEVAAPG